MAKIASFTFSLRLTAILCILVFGLSASVGMAADEERPELVPGLDLWTHKLRPAPYWELEKTAPDLIARGERHRAFMQGGVPLEYRSSTSPYPIVTKTIHDGGRLYMSHCASCHGSNGFGDGEAGRDLTPSPALLAHMVKRPQSVDQYLLWTISEGGAQFGTEMPAFKEVFNEQQIWQIVTYMRAGFPNVREAGQD